MSISRTRISGLAIASGIVLLGAGEVALGIPWPTTVTDPAPVHITSGFDVNADVITDGSGRWYAVWVITSGSIRFSQSTNNGRTWTTSVQLTTLLGGNPAIATDGAGNLVVAWTSNPGFTIQVVRSADHGATWTSPATLSSATGSSQVDLATDGAGNWLAAWRSTDDLGGTIGTDPDVLVSRSTDNGATWTAAAAANPAAGTDSNPDNDIVIEAPRIATDGSGNWLMVWRAFDFSVNAGRRFWASRSSDNGASWSALVRVDVASFWAVNGRADVATDGLGNWIAVFINNVGDLFQVRFARSTDNGATWSPGKCDNGDTCTKANDCSPVGCFNARIDNDDLEVFPSISPRIVSDGAGNWVVIWTHGDVGAPDQDIWFSLSTDNGATWRDKAPLNNDHAGIGDGNAQPALATDGANNWVALWDSPDVPGVQGGRDIASARFRTADPTCGDNFLDAIEECDGTDDAACPGRCVTDCDCAVCGDSVVEGGEECDEGDLIDGDGCDSNCTFTGCPNGIVTAGETCDEGGDTAACDGDCTTVACGDDYANAAAGEECDDGNTDPGDGCDENCIEEVCGNGVVQSGEECDDARLDNPSGESPTCDPDCTVRECGDSYTNATAGEECDDGDLVDGDGCDSNCTVTGCGNGIATAGEACDEGGESETCDADCTVAECGDDTYNASAGEECDGIDDDVCPGACLFDCTCLTGCLATSDPEPLNSDAATDSADDDNPQIITDGAGKWAVVWEAGAGDVGFSTSTDSGATWTTAVALNPNAGSRVGSYESPQIAADGAGHWVAVWHARDPLGGTVGFDRDILLSRSVDYGATWSAVAALNSTAGTDSQDDMNAQITTDGAGNWVAVWESPHDLGGISGDRDIFVSLSTNNGANWTAPATLNSNAPGFGGQDSNPHVATDGAGNWVAVWHSSDNLGGTLGTDFDTDILVSTSANNGASWTTSVALNTNAVSDSGEDFLPQVEAGGAGNWVVVWYSNDDLGGTIGTDWDVLVSSSADNGATWSAVAALSTRAALDIGDDRNPRLSTDGAGNWIAVWESDDPLGLFPNPTEGDVVVSTSTDNGTTWTTASWLNTNDFPSDDGWDGRPDLATDRAGNWVAVWQSQSTLFPPSGGSIGNDFDILYAPILCSTCGDAELELGEECDDGNADNTDACPDTCQDAECGDGFIWAGFEECDDGANNGNGDGFCLADCSFVQICGDGFVDGTEVCDDAGESDTCDADCTVAACGDGTLNVSAGEGCDDGNASNNDDCLNDCTAAGCGDSFVWNEESGTEVCDDGNSIDTDDCRNDCTEPPPVRLLEFRADKADGSGPYPVSDTTSPWVDLIDSHDGTLGTFAGDSSSGWQGDGTLASPHRLQFDGANDRVTVPGGSVPELQSATAYSVEMWFRTPSNVVPLEYLMEWVAVHDTPWGGMTLSVRDSTLSVWLNPWLAPGFTVQADTWYHVIVSQQPGDVRVYVDGQSVLSSANDNMGVQMSEIVIGASTFSGFQVYSRFWSGAIAHVVIFQGALDADEVLAEYRANAHLYHNVGACCIPTPAPGTCVDGLDQATCEASGFYNGGFSCVDTNCGCCTDGSCDASSEPGTCAGGTQVRVCLGDNDPIDGNDDACSSCGNSIVESGETCDDGNASNNDDCLNDCTAASCGDSFVWNEGSGTETCDDGNASNNDDCLNDCTAASCGDSFVWNEGSGTEECEATNDGACPGACQVDCSCTVAPNPLESAPDPFGIPGGGNLNRAGGFVMPASAIAGGQEVAIRIRFMELYVDSNEDAENGCPVRTGLPDLTQFENQVRYLGPPQALDDNDIATTPKFVAAELQCAPHYRDWSPAALTADFGAGVDTSTVYYYGKEVFPCSVHGAQQGTQACVESANENCFSDPLEIRTGLWGDVWPPYGDVSFTDIGKIVDAFKGIAFVEGNPPEGAPRKVRAMLQGNSAPFGTKINFTDIGKVVDAFKTIAYAEDGPTACP